VIAELEVIVAADEESRARLSFDGKRLDRDLEAARGAHERAAAARKQESCDTLESELAAIRAESDVEIAKLRASQEQYLAALAEAGERQLEAAAELYAQIVGGVS
jgi:hypothetical protein